MNCTADCWLSSTLRVKHLGELASQVSCRSYRRTFASHQRRVRPVELDVDYGAVCQREADAAIEIRGMPTGSGGTSLDAMNAAGLLHATSVVTVSCLIDVPPAPEDADAGGDAYRVAVERSVADTAVALLKSATEPAGTPDEALRSRLLSPALTDVAFGASAHTDGRLRMVVALVARPVLAVSLSGGAAEAGVIHVRASDVVSGGGDDEEGGGGSGGAGGGLGTFSVGVRSLAPEWAVLGAHLTLDSGPQARCAWGGRGEGGEWPCWGSAPWHGF